MVSIVVPVYNAEKTLGYCLDSILNSTYKNYEVILINDGSTDNSQIVIDKYKRKYPQIFRTFSQKNSGPAKTRNKGIKYSKGEYIFFIDNDDYIEKDYLEKFVRAIKKENSDMVIGGYNRVRTSGEKMFTRRARDVPWTKYMMVAPWGRIYRLEALRKFDLFFLESEIWEDVYFNMIANFKLKVSTLDYVGYNWVYNPTSISNTTQKKLNPFVDLTKVFTIIKKEIDKTEVPKSEEPFLEYFYIKSSVWYLLHSGRGVEYKRLKEEYSKLFEWLNGNYPKHMKNKQISILRPEGEDFSVRIIVSSFIIIKRFSLEKLFLKFYSRA